MRWFAHDLRATKLRKIAPMYFIMLWAGRGGKKNGDASISFPPQGYTNAFQFFPVRKSGLFHNPITNHEIFYSVFMYIFLDSWPPQTWVQFDGYHFFTIYRGIYWAEEYLFYFGAVWQSEKKIKHEKIKRTKIKNCDDAGGRTRDLRFTGDRINLSYWGNNLIFGDRMVWYNKTYNLVVVLVVLGLVSVVVAVAVVVV